VQSIKPTAIRLNDSLLFQAKANRHLKACCIPLYVVIIVAVPRVASDTAKTSRHPHATFSSDASVAANTADEKLSNQSRFNIILHFIYENGTISMRRILTW